jgi:hypothetical protein
MTPEGVEAELARRGIAEAAPQLIDLAADDEGRAAALFVALETQWRTAGMAAVMTGIDYSAIEPTARLIGVPLDGQVFFDLRTMEAEALKVFAERAAKERARP